ncbi:tetratricopeptide repeat protein [Alienimonas californiensis]|uniref:Tetratricopeptide repeat protein n=1 Tax=Alienimonas californiensis TaxID=2527989 RepID=A0A517PDF8_9PLAN|nr:tetratricopeptide repeat protein [Alienimonas californiensis]QDT17414.1 hypothetical protein CA12_35360 [Alienimonas californiensis]
MTPSPDDPLRFKFRFLNEQGQPAGLFRKKGRWDGETLTLDDVTLPAAALMDVQARDKLLFLVVPVENDSTAEEAAGPRAGTIGASFSGNATAQSLKSALDVARSAAWAESHREQLEAAGRGAAFRSATCPHCEATAVLSDMPKTPQVFCAFCETLWTERAAADPPAWETAHRICDECGYFAAPRKFTVFYFYFLLVVYGWNVRATWRCPACMRGDAWKMLVVNAPFVLGVPVALTQLARTYGSDLTGGPYAGLDAGNKAARAGKFDAAIARYRAILERLGAAAGVKYNLGLALAGEGETNRAADAFLASLDDCANYAPAYQRVAPLLEQSGRTEELAELRRQWA